MENLTLEIPKHIHSELVAHAKQELPNESCGYLAGKDGKVTVFYPMTNIDHSPEHFSFDPKEQFKVVKEARAQGISLLSVYHSHPETPARLSEEDIKLLNDPNMVYIIVSFKDPANPEVKGYRLNKPDEHTVEITRIELIIT